MLGRSIDGAEHRRMSTAYVHRHSIRPRKHSRLLAMPCVIIGLLVSLALGFVCYVLWPRWPGPPIGPDAPALPITVGGVAFNVPPAAIRVPMQRQPGAHERIDLSFLWPSLQPPDLTAPATVPTKSKTHARSFERIFVNLAAARDALPPEERVKSIYPRYAETEPVAGPEGLAVLPFRQGTPYQGEDLIYDAKIPANFLVRCSRNGAGATPGICLHMRRIGEADVTVRFTRDWLEDWRAVAANIERLIAKLRPPNS
jgi:hypothetical protein